MSKTMKVRDLFEKDIDFIKQMYDAHYRDNSYNTAYETLKIFEDLLEHNVDKGYEVSLNENYYDYQDTYYFFFTEDEGEKIYLLKLYGCSCGWDYAIEDSWERFVDSVLNEELIVLVDKLLYDLKEKQNKTNEEN